MDMKGSDIFLQSSQYNTGTNLKQPHSR